MCLRQLVLLFLFVPSFLQAQQTLVHVKLDRWAKDERFDRMFNPLALYYTQGDTIWSFDFEDPENIRPIQVKRPDGFKTYAYGYLFFRGIHNQSNPGQVAMLVCNLQDRHPKIFIDRNVNYDFTDDGEPILAPGIFRFEDTAIVELTRSDNRGGKIAIRLTRMNLISKQSYKNLLNEHYQLTAPGLKFVGIDYCFREQRYMTRSGIFNNGIDSFAIAIQDVNCNGLYNDVDTDRVIIGNCEDTVFDAYDELHGFILSEKKGKLLIERNGRLFELMRLDEAGQFLIIRQVDAVDESERLPVGTKTKKFVITDWQSKKHKITKFRKKQVYIYFTGTRIPSFKQDTMYLRKIADEFGDRVTVIGFIDVKKSYELTIFGTYSNLNWIAAYKDKYVIMDLKMRGLPSSILLGKKRRVMKYNLSPEELYKSFRQN